MTAVNRYEMSGSFKGVAYSITLESSLPDDECDPADDLGGKVLQAVKHVIGGQTSKEPVYFHRPKSATEWVGLCGGGGIMAAMAPGGVVPVSAVSCPKCLALMSPARDAGTYVENTTSREQEGQ